MKGRFSSPRPAGLAIPGEGEVGLEWAGIDLLLIHPWLPRSVNLEGSFAGRATGTLFAGQRLALKGAAALSGGKILWMRPGGEIKGNLRSASLSWDWRGEALRGAVALALAEQGQARGNFQLPLPARFPAVLDRKAPLQASLTGQVGEQGILASLFPGLVRESHGELDANLRVSGTWEEPQIEGTLKLAKAGAYLPTAGIHVKEVQLAMHLEKELVLIDSFRALSGPGHIEGTALIRLKGWQVADFRGSINGARFQTVHLPELQVLSSPNLTFEGAPGKLNIRGELRLPELLIFSQRARAVVLPSRDVILERAPKPGEKTFSLALDVQVRMVLGERVLVKVEGIDAKLDGSIDLVFRSLDKITSRGEIRVVKGRYRAYGADLEIVRGRLFYAGGSHQPADPGYPGASHRRRRTCRRYGRRDSPGAGDQALLRACDAGRGYPGLHRFRPSARQRQQQRTGSHDGAGGRRAPLPGAIGLPAGTDQEPAGAQYPGVSDNRRSLRPYGV